MAASATRSTRTTRPACPAGAASATFCRILVPPQKPFGGVSADAAIASRAARHAGLAFAAAAASRAQGQLGPLLDLATINLDRSAWLALISLLPGLAWLARFASPARGVR